MPSHSDRVRQYMALHGLVSARQLTSDLNLSQPTVSRAVQALGDEVVRMGAARSIQYALRDTRRGLPPMPVYRVDEEGKVHALGQLIPVRPDGFVMRQNDGVSLHSDGLPWWLFDMRPQGFLGRAYVHRHGTQLGLPTRLSEWSDTHVMHALLTHGHDAVGNLLLGAKAHAAFLQAPLPTAVSAARKKQLYPRLSWAATQGEQATSSAGGEQPKFTVYAQMREGPRHLLVKFTLPHAARHSSEHTAPPSPSKKVKASVPGSNAHNPVSTRWADLLLTEHHAQQALRQAGVPAAATQIVDAQGQRFLEVERFDRIGAMGRQALLSLAALDAQFVGQGSAPWPVVTEALARQSVISTQAAQGAHALYAYGTLIGNTDIHHGNISFTSTAGSPCELAPAYDMLPMAFAPSSSGALPTSLAAPHLHTSISADTWRQALAWAFNFEQRLQAESRLSPSFTPCLQALHDHLQCAQAMIERMGD